MQYVVFGFCLSQQMAFGPHQIAHNPQMCHFPHFPQWPASEGLLASLWDIWEVTDSRVAGNLE